MSREKGRKGQESRKRLLETAAKEFAHGGFHETKISTIVKKAELTQPSFYLYFSSKEAIFNELVDNFRSGLRKLTEMLRLEPGIEPKDVSKRVLLAVESVFRFLITDPDLTRIGLFLAPEAGQIKEELVCLIKENLEVEQQAGYFRPDLEMATVAECLIGMMERLTVSYLLPGTKSPDILAEQVVNLFMHGMFTLDSKQISHKE
ncbi:TetR/AcrR family transcriptional regulator [Risungbinella massiliensis]|uniref:TetR/AcrR family transcriptional regulator n=1 Tax=Risungbinella massiliensis TaxID=1329796 RepID=UPI0005CBCE4B|nr:TetR/AcrR family transcriptional regulator [Risungbinella massiliensis]